MLKDTPKCHKNLQPGLGQCCCNCGHHYKDFHHPWTTGKSIMEQRGWVCFIDDVDENTKAARALGINAITFASVKQLESELRRLEIL